MSASFASEVLASLYDLAHCYGEHAAHGNRLHDFPQDMAGKLSRGLLQSQPVYVSREIAEGLVRALPTLPLDIPLRPHDIPLQAGFAWLGGGFTWTIKAASASGMDLDVRGFSWTTSAPAGDHPGGAQITLWGHYTNTDVVEWQMTNVWDYGYAVGDTTIEAQVLDEIMHPSSDGMVHIHVNPASPRPREEVATVDEVKGRIRTGALNLRAMAYSLWSFMSSRDVVDRTMWGADRATRRRFEGYVEREERPLPQVEIVKLRARDYVHGQAEDSGRTIEERFIVRGHWHRFWYGPKDGSADRYLAARWLEPYIKGPDDMPLKNPQKVFEVLR